MMHQIPGGFFFFFWLLDKSVAIENLYRDRTPLSCARLCIVRALALSCACLGRCRRASAVRASQSRAHACHANRLYREQQSISVMPSRAHLQLAFMCDGLRVRQSIFVCDGLRTPNSIVGDKTFCRGQPCPSLSRHNFPYCMCNSVVRTLGLSCAPGLFCRACMAFSLSWPALLQPKNPLL